jgi:hypothetical protein
MMSACGPIPLSGERSPPLERKILSACIMTLNVLPDTLKIPLDGYNGSFYGGS